MLGQLEPVLVFSALFQSAEAAVTLVMAWGKMHLHGCWSGLPLQPVPVGFKVN